MKLYLWGRATGKTTMLIDMLKNAPEELYMVVVNVYPRNVLPAEFESKILSSKQAYDLKIKNKSLVIDEPDLIEDEILKYLVDNNHVLVMAGTLRHRELDERPGLFEKLIYEYGCNRKTYVDCPYIDDERMERLKDEVPGDVWAREFMALIC